MVSAAAASRATFPLEPDFRKTIGSDAGVRPGSGLSLYAAIPRLQERQSRERDDGPAERDQEYRQQRENEAHLADMLLLRFRSCVEYHTDYETDDRDEEGQKVDKYLHSRANLIPRHWARHLDPEVVAAIRTDIGVPCDWPPAGDAVS